MSSAIKWNSYKNTSFLLLRIFPGLTVRCIVVNVCAASLWVPDLVEDMDKRSSSPEISEPGPTDVGGGNSYAYNRLPGFTFCSSTIIF